MNSPVPAAGRAAGATWSATACAHPNIALVKYWGKRDLALNLPATGSLSLTLDTLQSRCQVAPAADGDGDGDIIVLNGTVAAGAQRARLATFVELALADLGGRPRLRVACDNNFPTGAGLASSASGFAALGLALRAAGGGALPPAELSRLCRRGSGSAARSVFGGFCRMRAGERPDGADAFAEPLAGPEHWPLQVLVAIVQRGAKAVGSGEGMERSRMTSPFYAAWCAGAAGDLAAAAAAVQARDFAALATVAEHSCLKMFGVMQASLPPLLYWSPATLALIDTVRGLRRGGLDVLFTCDAGPQVKAICTPSAAPAVARALAAVPGVLEVIGCGIGGGAQLLEP